MHSSLRSCGIPTILLLLACAASSQSSGAPAVSDLRCEGRVNPLGVDSPAPTFSWIVAANNPEQQQTAYEVIVASLPEWLSEEKADLWRSGRIISGRNFGVAYAGRRLASEANAVWKVRIWNERGRRSAWSQPAAFRMGLPEARDWEAKWIGRSEGRYRGAPNGYHAAETRTDAAKWVQVDLGEALAIDQVVLYPAKPNNWNPVTSGFGFPPVGRVEVSDTPAFDAPTLVARWEDGAALLRGDAAVTFDGRGARGRYVRVTSEHLWRRQDGSLCFALGELQVFSGGKNRALGAAVTARDSVENAGGWAMKGLTDGKAAGLPPEQDEFAAVLLRKSFAVAKPVARATLSACGLGYCIADLNGLQVSGSELDPGFTAFDRRVLYTTQDVTRHLQKGKNTLNLVLGGGWFQVATPELFGFQQAHWSMPPRALVRLRISFADGGSQVVTSDETWEAGTGPIQFQCVRGGETVDLTRPTQWGAALAVQAPAGKLQAQAHPAIGRHSEIPAVALTEPQPGVYQFKLAENTAGWPRLRVKGERGQKITLRCAEDFEPNGAISRNLNSHTYGRYQTDEFVLPDDGSHTFEPHFTYHGFQQVRVEGLRQKPRLEDLVGVRVHTLLEPAGSFECSDPMLNRIHEVCVRTYLNNLHGIPTDCPQREKAGWMLDGYVAAGTVGMWNFRTDGIYLKWLRDMADAQGPDGSVPSIVPTPNWWGLLDPWWGGACVALPWGLYERYGNEQVLRAQFPVMKRFVDYMGTRARGHLLDYALGDWLEVGSNGPANRTPVEITSTMAYFHCTRVVGRTAQLMGDDATARRYLALAENIRGALNQKHFDSARHRYAPDSQSASAMGLVLEVVPDAERSAVFAELVRNIREDRNGHISTGIVGTRFVFEALHAGRRDDLAYEILTQPDFPGWVHMLKNGATTVWETWEGGSSHNHPALAVVDAWLYEAIGGVTPDPGAIAFERFTVAPQLLGDVTWARTTHNTVRGQIESSWAIEQGRFTLRLKVPAGTRARVLLPSRNGPRTQECGAGRHVLKSKVSQGQLTNEFGPRSSRPCDTLGDPS
jgi:alpha-L-rhamnosidase